MNIARKGYSAFQWGTFGNLAKNASQLLIGIVLARLLGPEAFGSMALIWSVISIGSLFTDSGFAAILIQKKTLEEEEISSILLIQIFLSLIVSALILITSSEIAKYFNLPNLQLPIQAMAFVFLIRALSQIPVALATRSFAQRTIQGWTISSYIFSHTFLAIPLALYGWGVWAIVIAQMSQATIFTIAMHSRFRIRIIKPDFARVRTMYSFGLKIFASNILSWVVLNIETLYIGKYIGAEALGLYNRSYSLLSTPLLALVASLQNAVFATISRAEDKQKIRNVFYALVEIVSFAFFPTFTVIALVPNLIIEVVFGREWTNAAPVLSILSIAMPVYALVAFIGPFLNALGRADAELKAQFVPAVAFISTLLFLHAPSLETVSTIVVAIYILRLLTLLIFAKAVIGISFTKYARSLSLPLLLSSLCAVVTISVMYYGRNMNMQLLNVIGANAISCFIFLTLTRKKLYRNYVVIKLMPSGLRMKLLPEYVDR